MRFRSIERGIVLGVWRCSHWAVWLNFYVRVSSLTIDFITHLSESSTHPSKSLALATDAKMLSTVESTSLQGSLPVRLPFFFTINHSQIVAD